MSLTNKNPAYRRYMWRGAAVSAAYVASVFLASLVIPDGAKTAPLYLAVATLPGIFIGLWVWVMARLLIELDDEYLRFVEVQKALIATGFTLAWTGAWGLAELFLPHLPKVPIFFVFPAWCAALCIGQIIVHLRNRDAGTTP